MSDGTTPRPWRAYDTEDGDTYVATTVADRFGLRKNIALMSNAGRAVDGDAALIVRAVNAHDDLVAALSAILAAHDSPAAGGGEMYYAEAVAGVVESARAALAKAKGDGS